MHLSSAAALDRCRRARAAGLPVYVETRPLYLHLTRERFAEPDAAKYAGAPPLREASDRDALWAGLAAGDVDTLCSDHAPWTLDAKLDPALNAVTARQGVADLETLMPMLYSEGVLAGRISLDRFVALTSANAARIFGLYPRKGAIAVGSDADIALWDPWHRRTIDGARMQSLSGYSVYDGWQVQGWPKFVIRRGQLVLADGQITARPGDGEWLRRTTTARALPSRPRRPLPPGFTQARNYAYTASGRSCPQSQLRPRPLGVFCGDHERPDFDVYSRVICAGVTGNASAGAVRLMSCACTAKYVDNVLGMSYRQPVAFQFDTCIAGVVDQLQHADVHPLVNLDRQACARDLEDERGGLAVPGSRSEPVHHRAGDTDKHAGGQP